VKRQSTSAAGDAGAGISVLQQLSHSGTEVGYITCEITITVQGGRELSHAQK
jgi:hypothetical protein